MKYPYLPKGREFKFVGEDNPYMQEAALARRELATDSKIPTGSVIILDGKIIGRAGNQAKLKSSFAKRCHEKFCVRRFFGVSTGKKYWLCFGCASHRNHSETRAIRDALMRRPSIVGADLYLYGHWWSCKPCWDAMIASGIKNVYLVEGAMEKFGGHTKR